MKLRTQLAVVRYVLIYLRRRDLIITTAAMVALIINLAGIIWGGSGAIFWLAIVALLIDVIGQLRDFADLTQPSIDGLRLVSLDHLPGAGVRGDVPLARIQPEPSDAAIGYQVKDLLPGEPMAASNDIDRWLIAQPDVSFTIAPRHERRVLGNLRAHWHDFQDILALYAQDSLKNEQQLFNERKVALVGGLEPDAASVRVGCTSYFTSIVTNEASMRAITRQNRVVNDLRVLYPYQSEETPLLQPIEGSLMSDHIGVSLLARTSDGFIVEWMQGTKNQQNMGRIVPTASGSLDWHDIKRSRTTDLLTLVRYGMAREFIEEGSRKRFAWQLPSEDLVNAIFIIGFYRWLRRGGKPEFIGIAQLPLSRDDLMPNWEATASDVLTGEIIQLKRVDTVEQAARYCRSHLQPSTHTSSLPLTVLCWRINSILEGTLGSDARSQLVRIWNLRETS